MLQDSTFGNHSFNRLSVTVGAESLCRCRRKLLKFKVLYLGSKKSQKALFSAFDAAWAGVSRDKLSALKNVQFFCSRSTKFPKLFYLIFEQKNYAILTQLKLNNFLLKCKLELGDRELIKKRRKLVQNWTVERWHKIHKIENFLRGKSS